MVLRQGSNAGFSRDAPVISIHDSEGPVRIMLVDDQQIVLWALQQLVREHQPALEVVAAAESSKGVLQLASRHKPDVIVLEPNIEEGQGAALVNELVSQGGARVLLYTGCHDEQMIDRALIEGARGLVRKEDTPHRLISAIEKVHAGEIWVDRKTSGRLLAGFTHESQHESLCGPYAKLRLLTPREKFILHAMVDLPGARNKQIADHLNISQHTLRNHLSAIFSKLELHSRFELYSFVSQHFKATDRAASKAA